MSYELQCLFRRCMAWLEAELAASDYVKAVSTGTMEDRWAGQDIFSTTKSHPTTTKSGPLKNPRDSWPNWRVKVLETIG